MGLKNLFHYPLWLQLCQNSGKHYIQVNNRFKWHYAGRKSPSVTTGYRSDLSSSEPAKHRPTNLLGPYKIHRYEEPILSTIMLILFTNKNN